MSAVAEKPEKPGLMEMMGRAMNASDLSSMEGHLGNVERLAALGLSQVNPDAVAHAAREREPEIDSDAALGSLLIRLKAGRSLRSIPLSEAQQLVERLTHWVRKQESFTRWRCDSEMLHAFVRQSVAEWLTDHCPKCTGVAWEDVERAKLVPTKARCRDCSGSGIRLVLAGLIDRETGAPLRGRDGKPLRARVACVGCGGHGMRRGEKRLSYSPSLCKDCRGTGRRLANDGERARVLRVSQATYDRHWLKRFDWLRARLDRLDKRERNILQVQLGRV